MSAMRYGVIGVAAWLVLPGFAMGEDNQAGTPLTAADATGTWTLQTQAGALCGVSFSAIKVPGAGYGVKIPAACGTALPAGAAGWTPTAGGMAFTGSGGEVLMNFDRWSNSLLVAHRGDNNDLELRRGAPGT